MPKIENILCHKILNSRGDWTIKTEVYLDDGSIGSQSVPEGASKGDNEAVSLPVEKACNIVNTVINEALKGSEVYEQNTLDELLLQMDGTENKSNLGGNSILSVSLALARAASISKHIELYQYLEELLYGKQKDKEERSIPTPVFNIINGGKHASNNLSFQEFMVIPSKHLNYSEALEAGVRIYNNLKQELKKLDYDVGVGDEGGFAPRRMTVEKVFKIIKETAKKDYEVGKEIFFGTDVAAGSFYNGKEYEIKEEGKVLNSDQLLLYYKELIKSYEIIYLEDPFFERDYDAWKKGHNSLADKLMVIGDDLIVTNMKYLEKAVKEKMINGVIVKPNQIGTLSETLSLIKKAKKEKINIIISHRSGETGEDTFISDLSVASSAEFIKSGAPCRGERTVKYNRILDIYYKNRI